MENRPPGWGRSLGDAAERRFVPCLLVLLALGVVFRLALIGTTTTPSNPLNELYPGYTDGEEYLDNARSVVEEGVYGYAGRPSAFRPPAYPFLIAATWWLLGESLTPVRILQVGLFVAMTLIYARVVKNHFGKTAALLVAGLLSLYPLLAFLVTEIATESLYMALASALFALTFRLLDRTLGPARRAGTAFAAGLLCGVGTLTRPNLYALFLLLVVIVAVTGLRRREGWRHWMLPALALALGTYLVLVPWMIRNARVMGAAVLSTNLNYNLFRGTFDLVEGVPADRPIESVFESHHVLYEAEIEDDRRKDLRFGEVESEQSARAAALSIIRADPGGWLWQRFRNAAYLWLNLQWDHGMLHRNPLVFLAGVSTTLVYYALLAGALAGSLFLWRSSEDRRWRILVTVSWLYMAAAMPTVLTFVGKRYRVSMIDPYLVIVAGAALAAWLRRPGRAESSGLR